MQFIDEANIYIKAGNGGHGAVSFRREKYIEFGGPDGGNGGNGGAIILRSNSHLNTLLQFRYKKHFKAQNGEQGKGQNRTGKSGDHLILEVPIGTQIFAEDGYMLLYDFVEEHEEFVLIQGGDGGKGNSHFKSSNNRSPRRRTDGTIGAELNISLKLKLLSDVGLIGLPNSGKSTLLAHATSAKPKIADYPFTTLKPSLGIVYIEEQEFILADIPGLIRDAHRGKGLGDRFLKHIERCKVLIHLLDANNEDIVQDYINIRHELESFSSKLQSKEECICINKVDSLSEDELAIKLQNFEKMTGKKAHLISGYTGIGVKALLKRMLPILDDSCDAS